jgi:hypothetical protein
MPDEASLQGWEPVVSDDLPFTKVVELAFAYRGDVSLDLVDGTTLVGYLFNYNSETLDVIQTETGERHRLLYDQVRAIRFTGRDAAAGQSYEAWQRRRSANADTPEARA